MKILLIDLCSTITSFWRNFCLYLSKKSLTLVHMQRDQIRALVNVTLNNTE